MTQNNGEGWIGHSQRLWLYALCGLILLFLMLPCIAVIPMSLSSDSILTFPPRRWGLRWYENLLEAAEWRRGAGVSLLVALQVVVFSTIIGTAAAYSIKVVGGGAAKALRLVLMLPMVVPLILIAVGIFFIYARAEINNTIAGLVLAHTLLAIPFVVICVISGLDVYDMNQERVAQSLGASRLRAFLDVTFPQIRVAILSSSLFAFMTSFDETVVSLFISSGETSTLPKLMFESIRDQQDPTIAAASTIVLVVSSLALGLTQWLSTRQRIE